MSRITVIVFALVFAAAAVPAASAAPVVDGIFNLPGQPQRIAAGPDGNMWVTVDGANDYVKVTPDGIVTPYDDPNISNPIGITAGPDGNMWVTITNGVSKFSTGAPAAGTKFTVNSIGSKNGIIAGPDGNLWTASDGSVVKIPPSSPLSFTPYAVVVGAREIAASSDGLIWVADFGGQRIVSVTTTGTPTNYPLSDPQSGPQGVAGGPNGQILFSDPNATAQNIGRLVAGGTPQITPTPISDPTGITFGADGAYWIAQFGANNIARMTSDGQYTILPGIPAASGPRRIAAGPNNTVWATLETSNKIARITGVDPPPANGGTDTTPPVISSLSLTSKTFKVGKSPTKIGPAKTAVGTKIRFTLSEASSVTISIDKVLPGKRKGKKCVKPTKALKKAKNCKRLKHSGTLKRIDPAGQNTEVFSGRVGKRALPPGSYKLSIVATDSAGLVSKTQTANFRIVSR
jgi:streptogramin lyase